MKQVARAYSAIMLLLTFVYMKLNGIGGKPIADPKSRAKLEGNLAFKNEEYEDLNPYLTDNPELSIAWIDGYSEARFARNHRLAPK